MNALTVTRAFTTHTRDRGYIVLPVSQSHQSKTEARRMTEELEEFEVEKRGRSQHKWAELK